MICLYNLINQYAFVSMEKPELLKSSVKTVIIDLGKKLIILRKN